MSYQFKIKVFVGHKPVGWLKVGVKQTSIVLGLRSASKFESTTPSVFGAAMAELELPEPDKGGVPPVTFQFVKV